MMEDNIFLDDFIFYVLDNQVAIGIDNLPIIAQNIIYDGKNTLILQTSENKNYILQNIVLEVRQS